MFFLIRLNTRDVKFWITSCSSVTISNAGKTVTEILSDFIFKYQQFLSTWIIQAIICFFLYLQVELVFFFFLFYYNTISYITRQSSSTSINLSSTLSTLKILLSCVIPYYVHFFLNYLSSINSYFHCLKCVWYKKKNWSDRDGIYYFCMGFKYSLGLYVINVYKNILFIWHCNLISHVFEV